MQGSSPRDLILLEQPAARTRAGDEFAPQLQPCCTPFTTTGVGRLNVAKECTPTLREFIGAFQGGYALAFTAADTVCVLNPQCPEPRFVRYVNVKTDCLGKQLAVEVTVEWHCDPVGEKEQQEGGQPEERPETPEEPGYHQG